MHGFQLSHIHEPNKFASCHCSTLQCYSIPVLTSILATHRDADLHLNRNPFIETALAYGLSYITNVCDCLVTPASIEIFADNDYYSNPTASHANAAARFHNFGVPLSKAHKTGLGSSAALVTSFTAALLAYYLPKGMFNLATDSGKRRLHNLAQAAHCAAQGKVGSGFDVATAVYGSCLYRRFSPQILGDHVEPGQPGFAQQLVQIVDETSGTTVWDAEINTSAVKVPAGVRLVMCDVNCGSQTPGMVKKVLAWRDAQPNEANAIWAILQEANTNLAKELKSLAEQGHDPDYTALRECFQRIRAGIKDMSIRSGVPIEPRAQTQLLDACQAIPGVIGGVVPGAGGYDAITLLIKDSEDTVSALRNLFADYDFAGDGLSADSGGKVTMLGVREEMEGVRTEDVASYQDRYL
nr:phosphomevalonate kinase [Quercus suber]